MSRSHQFYPIRGLHFYLWPMGELDTEPDNILPLMCRSVKLPRSRSHGAWHARVRVCCLGSISLVNSAISVSLVPSSPHNTHTPRCQSCNNAKISGDSGWTAYLKGSTCHDGKNVEVSTFNLQLRATLWLLLMHLIFIKPYLILCHNHNLNV